MTWKNFCRALSAAGLPECSESMNHEGAHIFAHLEADRLLDRCSVMLGEYRSTMLRVDRIVETEIVPAIVAHTCKEPLSGWVRPTLADVREEIAQVISAKREG